MHHSVVLLLAISVLSVCWAQYFPQEVVSTVKIGNFTVPPLALNASDEYEYTQYKRIPFLRSSVLDRSYRLASEMYESTRLHREALENLYKHPLFLSRNHMAQSVGNAGDEARIQAFATKLISGQAVTVVALGGSITANHGSANPANGYTSRLFAWIEATFPNEGHRLLNHATPATTSSYVAPCVLTMIPEGTDLVFMEFNINDNADEKERARLEEKRQAVVATKDAMDKPPRHAMERMLRRVLNLPSSPAIIYLHAWAGQVEQKYYEGVEEQLTSMMSYYGVPSLSFRNAMYHTLRQDKELARRVWATKWEIHPSDTGARFMADMVIGFLMDHIATAAWVRHAKMLHRLHDPADMAATLAKPATPTKELPPPLFEGNFGNYTTDCIVGLQVPNYVKSNTGFNFTSEGPDWDPKWGFISSQPASQLEFKLPLGNMTYNGVNVVVGVGVLLSHSEVMGVAEIACVSGCTCDPNTFNTQIENAGYSMSYWKFLVVKIPGGSRECVILAKNLKKTYSQGHKIKVTGLLLSGEMGTLEGGSAWLEQDTDGSSGANMTSSTAAHAQPRPSRIR